MISVRTDVSKAVMMEFLTKGYGLRAFNTFTYVSGTVVTYRDKVMKFEVSSDISSITYSYMKKTILGTYELHIIFYVSSSPEFPRVSVLVKGKNKPGYPKVEKVARSFNLAKFIDALQLYERLYGNVKQKTELLGKEKIMKMAEFLSSNKGSFRLNVSVLSRTSNILLNDDIAEEVGETPENQDKDILLVHKGEVSKELAV